MVASSRLVPELALLVLLVIGLFSPARALEPRAEAEALLRAGNALYDQRDFRGAFLKYQRAKALYPSYKIDFNLALALEALGRRADAAVHFERFLDKGHPLAQREMIQSAMKKLSALKEQLGRVTVTAEISGASVLADGALVGTAPLRFYLEPGTHRLRFEEGERSLERTVTLGAGEQTLIALPRLVPPAPLPRRDVAGPTHQPLPAHEPLPPPERPFYKTWWFWTAIGVVVACGTVSAIVASRVGGDTRVPEGELGTITW
jgi:tetratricopeptide (TPR) repeat protein